MGRIARSVTVFVTIVALVASGCSLPGEKAHCGWEFRILKPPVLDTEMPVLIQSDTGSINGHPLGTVAGPVINGQFQHGAKGAPLLMNGAGVFRQDVNAAPCQPGVNRRVLTCEEWCELMKAMQTQRMPLAPE